MRYLLDTMIISEPARPRPVPTVVDWLARQALTDLALSVLTIGEIAKGIAMQAAGRRRATLEAWVGTDLVRQFAGRVLPIDDQVATAWGRLAAEGQRSGRILPVIDGLLVATAHVYGLALVTRNEADTIGRGVEIVNPYADRP